MRSRERPGDRQWATKDHGVGAALLESGSRSSCVFFGFGRKASLAVNDGSSIIHSYRLIPIPELCSQLVKSWIRRRPLSLILCHHCGIFRV